MHMQACAFNVRVETTNHKICYIPEHAGQMNAYLSESDHGLILQKLLLAREGSVSSPVPTVIRTYKRFAIKPVAATETVLALENSRRIQHRIIVLLQPLEGHKIL